MSAGQDNVSTLALRMRLLANGYTPLPALGKRVLLSEWTTLKVDAAEIATWERHPDWVSTGVRAPALDFDVKDAEAADAARQLVNDWLGDRGRILRRVGEAPKFLTPLRVTAPFPKIVRKLRAPNGAEGRIEILCSGQQFIADGPHPGTKKPYTWPDGHDLTDTPSSELPEIDESEAHELADHLTSLLTDEFGYELIEDTPKANGPAPAVTDPHADIETLLSSMTAGAFNTTHCHVIPILIRRAWHPDEICECLVHHTKQRMEALGLPWRERHQRRIILGRVKSAVKNLFVREYDYRTGTIPEWLAPDFHSAWMAALARRQRPELVCTRTGWAVHAAANGHDATAGPSPQAQEATTPAPSMFDVPLTVADWEARDLPPPDRLLGEWLTTTSRVYLSADTGIGKTSLGMALAMHCGAGLDFLHWRSHRQVRVLYVDGEMSRRLLRRRIGEARDRLGVTPPGARFLSREDIEAFPPLNTTTGLAFLLAFVDSIGGVDLIIFDNIMALLVGDQKDELSWNAILPLVGELTKRSIGQVWIDHTGHDTSRGYGSKTKQWRMDTSIHLTAVERADTDISFQLEFRKARERTPETRADFEDVTISLVEDQWVGDGSRRQPGKPTPQGASVLRVLDELLCSSNVVTHRGRRAVHSEVWGGECIRRGLVPNAHTFRTCRSQLAQRYLVECDGDLAWKP